MVFPSKRKIVRILKGLALILFLGGLLLWQLYSCRREPPLVQIEKIMPIMNFSSIQVRGVLESDARKLRDGSMFFVVDDETGTLPVFLDKNPDIKPFKAGSRVVATGRLNIGFENRVSMQVRSADNIIIESGPVGLASVNASRFGELLCVTGQVERVWQPAPGSKAPCRITLVDKYGRLDVIHWLKSAREVQRGEQLSIRGKVNIYKDRTQLKVDRPIDIQVLH